MSKRKAAVKPVIANTPSYVEYPSAGLLRRFASIVYDMLILWAIWIGIGFANAAIFGIESTNSPRHLQTVLFPALLLGTFVFYSWFWTHGGQTLGMRAWRLKVVHARLDGSTPNALQCASRLASALVSILAFGMGYLWVLIDPNSDTWHDRLSNTRTLVIPKEENKKVSFFDKWRKKPK